MRWSMTATIVGVLVAAPLTARLADAESLVEAVESALAYHPQISRDQAESVAAEHAVEEAFSGFLPRLDFDTSGGVEVTNSPTTRGRGEGTVALVRSEGRLTLSQLLFDFFETSNRVASAESELESSNATLQATNERIARLATGLYLDVTGARERVEIAQLNVDDLSEIVELIRGRAQAGRVSEADVDQAVSRLALAQADLAAIRGVEREAVARYLENVGQLPGVLTRPEEPDYPQATDLDAALTTAMERNPIAFATSALWDARKSDIEVARAAYYPRFDIEATGAVGDNLDGVEGADNDIGVLLRMRWNLFSGFGDVARTRAATFEANAASRVDAEARREIREAVRVAYRVLEAAKRRLPELRDDREASQRTFDAYSEQYNVGQRTLLDLLDARDELFDAQDAEVVGIYTVLQAHYDLLFGMGLLLETMGIVVFQDAEQYEQNVDAVTTDTTVAAVAPNPGQSFSEMEWIGEVVFPGAHERGMWLGEEAQRGVQERPARWVSRDVPTASVDRMAVRREFADIDVEVVPAMASLPESNVVELMAMPVVQRYDDLAGDQPGGTEGPSALEALSWASADPTSAGPAPAGTTNDVTGDAGIPSIPAPAAALPVNEAAEGPGDAAAALRAPTRDAGTASPQASRPNDDLQAAAGGLWDVVLEELAVLPPAAGDAAVEGPQR